VAKGEDLKIDFKPVGKTGKARLTVRYPDGTPYTDTIQLGVAADRQKFVSAVCKGRRGIDKKAVAEELERIAACVLAPPNDDKGGDGGDEPDEEKLSQADKLVRLAECVELFHTPGADPETFAVVEVNGHKETLAVRQSQFRGWLLQRFFTAYEKAPGGQAMQDAVNTIDARAKIEGSECPVFTRVAECDGAIWLDLADADWRAVRVKATGWEVVADPPVRFIRRRGMLPLPVPVTGGRIVELRSLVNLPDDDQWILAVAWTIAALRPGRPFPVLVVNGEQGSAKTTLCKMLRALIDPNEAPLRRTPREEQDLVIAAKNSWVVGFDNLSGLKPNLSDALCCLSTGNGFGKRKLYTDDEEALFNVMRPVLINGIEDIVTRPDLLDRSVQLMLRPISDKDRRDEDSLWAEFEQVRPRVLGALLTAVCTALKGLPSARLPSKPRMADFAKWVVAAEPALGWPAGRFMEAYTANRDSANDLALECAAVAGGVQTFMADRSRWEGTWKELLAELNRLADDATRKDEDWPKSARGLSGQLRRIAPNLRRAGIDSQLPDRKVGGKRAHLLVLVATPAAASTSEVDGRDGRDGVSHTQSNSVAEEVGQWTG
jgi:hypothetical protein